MSQPHSRQAAVAAECGYCHSGFIVLSLQAVRQGIDKGFFRNAFD
jgi:aerobic-type carbon monoxide dehydrogenase small subunit (CoxS/CutS family)